MCSACSNDDLRPELAGGFAVSSPVHRPRFAFWRGGRRKYYRTLSFLRDARKASFLQGFSRLGGSKAFAEPPAFARLGNRAIVEARDPKPGGSGEREDYLRYEKRHRGCARASSEPVEIRVSADAIIEVSSTGRLRHVAASRRIN